MPEVGAKSNTKPTLFYSNKSELENNRTLALKLNSTTNFPDKRRHSAMTDALKFGSQDFYKLTGADNCRLRLMEADGTLSPVKTKSGWRIFSDSDVRKARKWMTENTRQRASA